MSVIYIDVGSSTIKAYSKEGDTVQLVKALSTHFKEKISTGQGLGDSEKAQLVGFIKEVKRENPNSSIRTYGTAFLRELSKREQQSLIDEVFIKTEVKLNLLSSELETYYLEYALMSRLPDKLIEEGVLILNIGGGSTELIFKDGEDTVKKSFNIGVGTVLSEYPSINEWNDAEKFSEITKQIRKRLPEVDLKPKYAFYTGGELEYMLLTEYLLKDNDLFQDGYHPKFLEYEDFIKRSKEIYKEMSLEELKNLKPDNPDWMVGAKPCTIIADAIFNKYEVKYIIPSDTNLAHGINRKEFRNVAISGSFRKHLDYILSYKDKLENSGATVLSPRFEKPKNPGEEFVVFEGEEGKSPLELERFHLNAIEDADVLLVCDPNGYVGASAMLEVGYAHALGRRVVFTECPEEFMLNTLPGEVM